MTETIFMEFPGPRTFLVRKPRGRNTVKTVYIRRVAGNTIKFFSEVE